MCIRDRSTGAPGSSLQIKVRGTGTITAGTSPLYVVAGVPLAKEQLNTCLLYTSDVYKRQVHAKFDDYDLGMEYARQHGCLLYTSRCV